MIRESINLKPILPMKRQTAAEIATLASRFDCTCILESRNVILNAKSMLGLLSMTENGDVTLVADGEDEAAAAAAMKELLGHLMAQ